MKSIERILEMHVDSEKNIFALMHASYGIVSEPLNPNRTDIEEDYLKEINTFFTYLLI